MKHRRRTRSLGVVGVAACLLLVGWVTALHTALEASDPPKDAELAEAPMRVTLDYTTDVQIGLSRVTVTALRGGPIETGALTYLAEDQLDVLVAPLPTRLGPGPYVVAWTTAGPDGHALSGEFSFTVLPRAEQQPDTTPEPGVVEEEAAQDSATGGGTPPSTQEGAVDTSADPNRSRSAILNRWLFYLGIIGVLGAVSFRFLVLPQVDRGGELEEVTKGATTTLWRILGLSCLALLASAPFRLWFQSRAFFGEDALGGLGAIATQGPWGKGWLLQVGLGLLIGAGFMLARPLGQRLAGWGVIAVGALLLPTVPVLSGHALSRSPQAMAIGADFLHILAAGSWVGGLFCLLFAGLPALRAHGTSEGSGQPGLTGMVAAFSRVAVVSVCLLALSGALNTWLHVESFSQIWTTPWGRMLLTKLAVVAGVLGLGFYNWRFVRPALAETPRPGLLKGPATLELLLGALAIAATSLLVALPLS